MQIANYHTHTVRCRHAVGTEREYIETAIANGMKVLGFSDHTPFFTMPEKYYSEFRMFPYQAEEYFETLTQLKKEYEGRINILRGLEVEFYPAFFGDLLEKMRKLPVDYFILGQHYPGNEIGYPYVCDPISDEDLFEEYIEQLCRAMDTETFTYIAHPDMFNFTGDEKVFVRKFTRLCEYALKKDVPLEINFKGIREGYEGFHYSTEKFLRIAGEVGNKMVLGCDAHDPKGLSSFETYNEAMRRVRKYNLNLLDTVDIKDPKKGHFE